MATTVVNCGINNYKGNFWDVALNRTSNKNTAKTGLLIVDLALYTSVSKPTVTKFINFYKSKGVTYTLITGIGFLSSQYFKETASKYDYIYICGKGSEKTNTQTKTMDDTNTEFTKRASELGIPAKNFCIPMPFAACRALNAVANLFRSIFGFETTEKWPESFFHGVSTLQDIRKLGTGKMVGVSRFTNDSDFKTKLEKEMSLYGKIGTTTKTLTGKPFKDDSSFSLAQTHTKYLFGVNPSITFDSAFTGILGHTGHSSICVGTDKYFINTMWWEDGNTKDEIPYVEKKDDPDGYEKWLKEYHQYKGIRIFEDERIKNTVIISNGCNTLAGIPVLNAVAAFGNTRYGAINYSDYNGFYVKFFYEKIKEGWSLGQAALGCCGQHDDYWATQMTLVGNPAFRIV